MERLKAPGYFIRLFFLPVILSACAGVSNDEAAFDPANMEYAIDITESGRAELINGYYEESAAPGSASKISVRLETPRVFGDIDGNGIEDAAFILRAEGGGSGTFSFLAVVLDYSGNRKVPDAVFIGDRILVEKVTIRDGEIRVEYLGRKEDESMSDTPGEKKVLVFRLSSGSVLSADNL